MLQKRNSLFQDWYSLDIGKCGVISCLSRSEREVTWQSLANRSLSNAARCLLLQYVQCHDLDSSVIGFLLPVFSMAPTFGYWDIRGLAEPIRYLLHYVGIKFEDKRYTLDNRDEWANDKDQLGLDFPNLPYYLDEKVKLTQSTTILRYLARKYKLTGSTEEEQVRLELLEQQLTDIRTNLIHVSYCPESDFENKKAELIKTAPNQLKMISDFLGNKKWFGGEITYVDFMAYTILDFYWLFIPGVMNDFPTLKQYIERFEKLPALQNYFTSATYKRWPLFGDTANFGGKGPEPKRV